MRLVRFALVAAFIQLPCLAAPREIPLVASDGAIAWNAGQVDDYDKTSGAIVALLTRRFQLPVPRYTLEVYSNPAEFGAALIANLSISAESARTAATFAKAAVGNGRIMLNEPAFLLWNPVERVVGLAHEIVHTSEAELAEQQPLGRHQWLVEGFAEWVAFQVAHELGATDLAQAREGMVARVREARAATGLARLAELDSLEQWIDARQRFGFDAMYPYTFLALDFLVARHSYDRALDFFRRYAGADDADGHFRAAFGEDLAQFQAALDAHLVDLLR